MDEKLKSAYELFYKGDYKSAKEIFLSNGLYYEAGLCSLLLSDTNEARKYFKIKENICPASSFGLIILDIIEDNPPKLPKYFQVRSFLEIYINLLIENSLYGWAQKIINKYGLFTNVNLETPKFIARVLFANNQNKAVHSFAEIAKEVCYYDAEIHFIDASLYYKENNLKAAKQTVEECLKFAPDYYPVVKLNEELDKKLSF